MSGIVGTFGLDGAPARPPHLRLMVAAIAHRGPDGCAVWTDGAVGLGHAAHHTTPEAEAETWPLVRTASGIVLVADARIDNRAELLRALDPIPNEQSVVTDADLIAAAYERWGLDCAESLIGDFAFALWDPAEQRLFCVRDGVGTRPFFYAHLPDRIFAFASELKALFSLSVVPKTVNEDSIAEYLTGPVLDEEATFYRKIHRLCPGHALTVTPGRMRPWRYWELDPDREVHLSSDEEYEDAFREHFDEAVRCRLRSSTPAGASLSGGIDSSAVAVTARELRRGSEPLSTFSIIYDEFPDCDERTYMQAVLSQGGFAPQSFRADDVNALRSLPALLDVHDAPFFAPNLAVRWAGLPRVRAAGTTVLLDGHGGDEVVSRGYERLHELAQTNQWATLTREVWQDARFWGGNLGLGLGGRLAWQYGVQPWMEARPWAQRAYGWWRQVRARIPGRTDANAFPGHSNGTLLRKEVRKQLGIDARQRGRDRERRRYARSARGRHYLDLGAPMQGRALEILNRTAARRGVELRFPFLDRRLMAFCLALPAEQKRRHGWGRSVLRRALGDRLPAAIRRRRSKTNFATHFAAGLMSEKMTLDALVLDPPPQASPYLNTSEVERLLSLFEKHGPETPGPVLFGLWRGAVLAEWMRSKAPTDDVWGLR